MKSDLCTHCKTPRDQWPAIFKGDDQCSVICKKAAEHAQDAEPALAPSECST